MIAACAVAAAGCPCPPSPACPENVPSPEADPNTPPPEVDPASYGAMDAAAQACAVLKYLKCSEIDHARCADDVRKLVMLGTFEGQNLRCIRESRTVQRVRFCSVDCKQ